MLDGNWKLAFSYCMFPIQNIPVAIKLSLPAVCPEEPKGKEAFCTRHCALVEQQGIPTRLKDFLAFSGIESKALLCTLNRYCLPDKLIVHYVHM